ncbi:MAG: glutathione S-transferase [Polaromonas sp.]|nr:glutathione S-transferase [Polaromonas sp.]
MKLIGMLDSPYVRRVAISLQLLGLRFEHQSLSVFSTFEEFALINPVVKAPSLVCDDGQVLIDSTLITDYAELLSAQKLRHRTLMPAGLVERQRAVRMIGLALVACEKSIQIVYEHKLRPAEKLHQPWIARVTAQMLAACDALETEMEKHPLAVSSHSINQAGISTAVAWHFMQQMVPEVVDANQYPLLCAFSVLAEELDAFRAAPHGASTYRDP